MSALELEVRLVVEKTVPEVGIWDVLNGIWYVLEDIWDVLEDIWDVLEGIWDSAVEGLGIALDGERGERVGRS